MNRETETDLRKDQNMNKVYTRMTLKNLSSRLKMSRKEICSDLSPGLLEESSDY
jgi:hypothetical protein